VDEKLFDVKHVFKDSEVDLAAAQVQREITSVAKLLEKRRHRTGYADDAPLTVYKALPFEEFLSTENPFPLFLEYNRIELTPQQTERYMKLAKPPADIDELLSDIQVLGKREILQLLKWKSKIKHAIWKSKKQDSVVAEPQEDVEEAEVEEVEEADEDVEEDEEEDLQFEDEVAVEE
jgi:AdoMet-dependent rRNA methyltransferase SPB1